MKDDQQKEKNITIETQKKAENIEEENTGSEFEVCKKQAEEYLNNWKRERADFLNYKKDESKRLEEFVRFANEDLLMETIEVLDDLERARQTFASQNLSGQAAQEGLSQVLKKFQDLLGKYGVERIKVKGEKFEPALHEATESEAGGEKLEEVRAGYTMHGRVIRPARVKIIK